MKSCSCFFQAAFEGTKKTVMCNFILTTGNLNLLDSNGNLNLVDSTGNLNLVGSTGNLTLVGFVVLKPCRLFDFLSTLKQDMWGGSRLNQAWCTLNHSILNNLKIAIHF